MLACKHKVMSSIPATKKKKKRGPTVDPTAPRMEHTQNLALYESPQQETSGPHTLPHSWPLTVTLAGGQLGTEDPWASSLHCPGA